jgi:hypothetical protein
MEVLKIHVFEQGIDGEFRARVKNNTVLVGIEIKCARGTVIKEERRTAGACYKLGLLAKSSLADHIVLLNIVEYLPGRHSPFSQRFSRLRLKRGFPLVSHRYKCSTNGCVVDGEAECTKHTLYVAAGFCSKKIGAGGKCEVCICRAIPGHRKRA